MEIRIPRFFAQRRKARREYFKVKELLDYQLLAKGDGQQATVTGRGYQLLSYRLLGYQGEWRAWAQKPQSIKAAEELLGISVIGCNNSLLHYSLIY